MDGTADAKPEPTDAAASKVSEPQVAGNPTPTGEDAKPSSTEPVTPAPKAVKKRAASDGAAATKAAKRQKVELTVGDKGVFFTTVNTGGAANAKRDLQNLLEDAQGADPKTARKEETSPPGKPKFVPCTEAGKGSGLLKLVSDSPEPSKASFNLCPLCTPTAMAVEDICKNDEEDRCEGNSELPDLLELIEVAESSTEDVARFAEVLRQVGRRVKASPEDRDLLSDFEGISQICDALSKEPHQWQGEAMLAFCRTMPDVCRTSVVNRASLRDAGFLAACIRLLHGAACKKDEATAVAASTALAALCTASDANKQMAMVAHEEPCSEQSGQHGVLRVLLDVLEMFPDSAQAQAESMAALRSLVVDDDTRKAEIAPSALENRELLLGDELYPEVKRVVQNACQLSQHHPQIVKLGEQALLLLREIARGHDRIQEIAKPSNKLLAFVQKSMESSEPRIVRAAMAVLRAFALCEDVRDELSLQLARIQAH
ncbi:unnamed protein product [Symbiodinium sp. CCMP2592]|nr:unnamed protein product [Symbiodinium sp. CCMP2592]